MDENNTHMAFKGCMVKQRNMCSQCAPKRNKHIIMPMSAEHVGEYQFMAPVKVSDIYAFI